MLKRLQTALAASMNARELHPTFADVGTAVAPIGADLATIETAAIAKYKSIVTYAKLKA